VWTIPRMWAGQSCAILASGPSMSQEVADTVRYTRLRTICINTTFKLAPWADMLYAADADWWKHKNNAAAQKFEGLKVTAMEVPYPDVLQLNPTGHDGFDPNPANIRKGHNSGYQAVHIAAHAGCTRILLCGFDMRGGHWHGDHPQGLRNHHQDVFAVWIKAFDKLGDELEQRGIEVVNCTPGSALKRFRCADLKDEIEACALATA
jgi:predicted peroxiredoxin